eukprot:gene2537-2987_t
MAVAVAVARAEAEVAAVATATATAIAPTAATARGLFGAFGSTFALTASSPMTILSFAGLLAALAPPDGSMAGGLLLVAGVFAGSIAWWALLVGAYALFWFALVVAVNAFGAPSATNAMVLMIAWVLLVLVAPVLLNLAVTQASPAPSRTELATQTRTLTAAAMKRHAELLSTDYKHVGQGALLLPRDGKIEISARGLANYRIE